ncbi:hypothetical protein MUK42_28515 [Musa troglodytarum]|uniref:adenine phosphoribosyltransferase n=1 Tax=Musa troglodytarum TaxID=320322 RepID=A0A9E7EZT3_9LILI|nr:hypothetical protein MUK42_28515 [Musa troglodytarum]
MHVGAIQPCDRALVVDDLVATGGTLRAAMNLLGPRKVEWQTPLRTDGVQMMVIFLADASAASSLFFFPICSHERTICCSINVISFFCAALSSMGTTKWQLHQAFLFPILTYAIDQKAQRYVISSLNSQF